MPALGKVGKQWFVVVGNEMRQVIRKGYRLTVTGLVQGVGFRPFVWHLARQLKLMGQVWNDAAGVTVELVASSQQRDQFIKALTTALPPLARIEHLSCMDAELVINSPDFQIIKSRNGDPLTGCVPDAATCPACISELKDPSNRRYRYPFINCTHCGPRLSILRGIPYDRYQTSMAEFRLCEDCQEEYDNPADRRFHAQPNACAACGPRLWVCDGEGREINPVSDPFQLISEQILQGNIIAIKGIGGFHLVCDATSKEALQRLRERKQRPDKPFALMFRDCESVQRYACLDSDARQLLQSASAPIVLLASKYQLPKEIAPGQSRLGCMLPHSPVHHLLLESFESPLVMTSANRSGSPQVIDNDEVVSQLQGIADYYVLHDREIVNRVDDSVVAIKSLSEGSSNYPKMQVIRRARGYAPAPIKLPPGFERAPDLLALGGELKNTICLIKGGQAIVSQHLGDLEDVRTYDEYLNTIERYQCLYALKPFCLVADNHPEYLSSKYAKASGKRVEWVQHHHAHLSSCLAEHQWPLEGGDLLGLALDGLGLGDDGTLWGGEVFQFNYRQYTRVAHFDPVPLVGGVQAILEPWRCLVAQLYHYGLLDEALTQLPWLVDKPIPVVRSMLKKQLNSPMSSSAGRLFDAVAALLGLSRDRITYEGQAAIELESLAERVLSVDRIYPMDWRYNGEMRILCWERLWSAMLDDLSRDTDPALIACAFHHSLAHALANLLNDLSQATSITTVVLSGGVAQNRLLCRLLAEKLASFGLTLLTHKQLPANDGGLSYGQAVVAAARQL